jgi:hypothetical protein
MSGLIINWRLVEEYSLDGELSSAKTNAEVFSYDVGISHFYKLEGQDSEEFEDARKLRVQT